MRLWRFGWQFFTTFIKSHRDPAAETFRNQLGPWFQGLDGRAEAARAEATWNTGPSPEARLDEFGGDAE